MGFISKCVDDVTITSRILPPMPNKNPGREVHVLLRANNAAFKSGNKYANLSQDMRADEQNI